MKLFLSLLMLFSLSFAEDSTIEVIKRVDSLPSIAVEDSSISYDDTFKMRFFKSIVADLNVISIFNVDRHYRKTDYDSSDVVVENKDMKYVLRLGFFFKNKYSTNTLHKSAPAIFSLSVNLANQPIENEESKIAKNASV